MHPDEVRYWDGHDWTAQWRPRPTWAPSETQIIRLRPPSLGQRRHRTRNRVGPVVFTAVLAAALLSSAVLAGRQGSGLGATDGIAVPIISDPSFVSAANHVCARLLHPSGQATSSAATGATGSAIISRAGSSQASSGAAASLTARARTLAAVERGLGSLAVDPADRAAVQDWLATWGVAASATSKEARALRSGTSAKADRSQALTAEAALDDFTETNAISHCAV
jgi:hypothetical protein